MNEALVAPAPVADLLVARAHASSEAGESGEAAEAAKPAASAAGEAGEAGEAGVAVEEGPVALLTQLGYFEGTYLIAAQLYLDGDHDLARAHLEESHHAFYEDIEGELEELGVAGFEAEADAFLNAIRHDMADAMVKARLDDVLAETARVGAAAGASGYERLKAVFTLMQLAAAEYEGGVSEGKVELPIEYRDSWGFYEVAKRRAEAMAGGDDAALAAAGRDVLDRMAGLDALYPALEAGEGAEAAADGGALSVAAGWIEIIALRQKK